MRLHLPIVPPTATHQAKKIVRFNGFSRLADKPELVAARESYQSLLIAGKPEQKIQGPISLKLTFVWPHKKGTAQKHRGEMIPKVAKPDCDNLSKTLTDAMARALWFDDDALVYSLTVAKYHGPDDKVGVWIEVRGSA